MQLEQQTRPTTQQIPLQKVKTKVRFTSLDIAAMVAQMQSLVGLRVSNIYDLSPTTYIFKLAKAEHKHQLLIENGVRFHLADELGDKKRIPSGFTMRFRRFLRSKRLDSIRQVGVQRVVVLTFGSDNFANHLILELYSQGNIILTDHTYRIVQCIRSHQYTDKIKTAIGQIYPFQHAAHIYLQNIEVSPQKLEEILQVPQQNQEEAPKSKKKNKDQNKGAPRIKDIVFKMIPCLYPQVIEHILAHNSVDSEIRVEGEQGKQKALEGAHLCHKFLKEFVSTKQKGYLYSKGEDYFQVSPFANCKLEKYPNRVVQSFGQAVQEYFAKYKKSAHQEEQQFEELAWKKYEQIRKDQEQRVRKLITQQQIYDSKAQLIQINIQDVEAVLKIISTMENNGYSWQAMERMISDSRKTGDPLANMIHTLNPAKRQITILLSNSSTEEADLCSLTPVELQVDYNAYTNATMYYGSRKKQQHKQTRTRQASEQVLKIAQKDAKKKIQKKKNDLIIKSVPTRKQLWFEKFYWFVTSEGWLVISGRDSHQNQLIVKRYMKAGDLYMHSDYGGAASTVIKGPPKTVPPRGVLQEAAVFTVCRSKAWDTKIISSAWWVYHDQVSKSAPTGEFLPTGSFMIRGKRNFVHPNRMQMGFTLLYRLDPQSAQRRVELKKELLGQIKEEVEQPELTYGQSVDENEESAFLLDLQAQARKARQKKKQKHTKNKTPQVQQQKEQEVVKESDEDEESNQSEQQKPKFVKKEDKKKQVKKEKLEDVQKHKNKNKKKLKKLQKYMEEQDEDERQMILKMLGAKEMKHLQAEEEEEEKPVNKKQGKKLPKKKGISKFIQERQEDEAQIDTEKVLFLKANQTVKEEEVTTHPQPKVSKEEQPKAVIEEVKYQKIQQVVQVQKKEEVEQIKQTTQNKLQEGENQPQVEKVQGLDGTEEAQQPEEPEEIEESSEEQIEEEKVEQEKEKEDQVQQEKVIDSELADLIRLVGRTTAQDRWDCLIPMCAPYNTIKDNKFKIKLVPGGLKKGKAARGIQSYFANGEIDELQKPFVRAMPEQELINAVIGNVKLGGAGLLKMQQKVKAEKKEKRKEEDRKGKND